MTIGQRLADARRNLGLSLEALSSQTGFSVDILRAIEETDLLRLPSGHALEGAVQAYAAAVQLDAEAVRERYVADLPILTDTAEALEAFEPERIEPETSGSRLFAYESASGPNLSRDPGPRVVDDTGPVLLLRHEPDFISPRLALGHDAGPMFVPPAPDRPSRFPIAVLLVASTLAVVAGYLLSARGDWWPRDRSSRTASRVVAAESSQVRQADPNVAQAIAPSTPPSPPAPAANSAETTPPSDSRTAPLQTKEAPDAKPPERSTPASRTATRAVDTPVPSAVIVVPGSRPAAAPTSSAVPTPVPVAPGELAGSWNVIAHDEASTPETDANRVAYYLRLDQRGSQVVGSGYRVSAEGAETASSQQSVAVRGTLSGERLTLDFSGQDREHIVLYRSQDGTFRGRFRREGAPTGGSLLVTLSPKEPVR